MLMLIIGHHRNARPVRWRMPKILAVYCRTLQALEKQVKAAAGKDGSDKELEAHQNLHGNPSDGKPANESAL